MFNTRIFRILTVFPTIFCVSCNSHTKSNAEEYLEILAEAKGEVDFHTELYILPATIENLEIKSFYYASLTDVDMGSYLFYLILEYDETTYSSEIDRLTNIKADFKDEKAKTPISYPEYNLLLTIKDSNKFEYVIYDEASFQVAYISNQLFEWDKTPVDSKYILPDVVVPKELDDGENMYNMYYWYEGDSSIYVK